MPFGLTNAPAVFQRLVQEGLDGLNPEGGPDFVTAYLDDILTQVDQMIIVIGFYYFFECTLLFLKDPRRAPENGDGKNSSGWFKAQSGEVQVYPARS